jgi:hypothetical protein
VHDLGNNLVDMILTENDYRVITLSNKVPRAEMLKEANERKADAIGMSRLLLKSTVVMRKNLEEAHRQHEVFGQQGPDPAPALPADGPYPLGHAHGDEDRRGDARVVPGVPLRPRHPARQMPLPGHL